MNLALMLSKVILSCIQDARGGKEGKEGKTSITKSNKQSLQEIDKEQEEFENYQMKFGPQSNETCCLLL